MNYDNEQKNELDNKLRQCVEDMSEANRYKKLIKSTEEDYGKLTDKWHQLKEAFRKEEQDVEKLTKVTLTNFLHTIMNDKAEKLDKEKQEAITAKLKCDSVLTQLEDCKISLEKLNIKYNKFSQAEEEYKILLKQKRDFILTYMPDKWNEIESLMEEDRNISNQLKEIDEAINAGENTRSCIDKANEALHSAKNWGTWDMLGGGLLSTMAKRENMSEAQSYISDMQKWIRSFARELSDVDDYINADLDIGDFLGFADYFFDGFFVDWAVQSKINSAIDKVDNTKDEVNSILRKLVKESNELKDRRYSINNQVENMIEEA
ncbi:hypothetical protein AN1V17_11190 [Vallitalea sediminicola]